MSWTDLMSLVGDALSPGKAHVGVDESPPIAPDDALAAWAMERGFRYFRALPPQLASTAAELVAASIRLPTGPRHIGPVLGRAVPAGQTLVIASTGNVPLVMITWACAGVPTIAADWVELGDRNHPLLAGILVDLPFASRVRVVAHAIEVLAYGELTRELMETLASRLTLGEGRFFTAAPYR